MAEIGSNWEGDLKKAKKIIDQLWPYLDSIGLTGMGETFMFNEIEEVVDYIKSKNKGIIISVSTNAVLPSFIKRASKIVNKIDDLTFYEYAEIEAGNRVIKAIAVIFKGAGLWGPIEGVIAFEPDLKTIRGIRFYSQEETPGLV